MKLKEFFIGRATFFFILIIIGFGIFIYKTYFTSTQNTDIPSSYNNENIEPPVFTWKYEKDKSLNLDGFPNTNIFLEAKYGDGSVINKLIDTTPSGCNDLPDKDEDSVLNSTNIQCYGAGLGYRFKVTKGAESYLVERKKFEEASPDYNPPSYKFEVISEFPITNN